MCMDAQVSREAGCRERPLGCVQLRFLGLIRLNVGPSLAGVARSGRGAWRLAGGKAMQLALSNKTLRHYRFLVRNDLD